MEEKKSNKEKKEIDATKEYKIKNKKPNTKRKKIIKTVLIVFLLTILILAGVAFGILYGIIKDAKLEMADLAIKYENSVIKDIEGNTIAILSGDENREFITISEMSEYLPVAFVSIEDERFNKHMGIDIKRTIGATAKYALSKIGIGSANYGGSTITQQVVKNITQEKERTWQRKVKEIARAYYLEKELSKDQILELYLNLIFMGGNTNIYGVEVASNYYFSKSAGELDLAECAFLAGINNTPNSYNPFTEDNTMALERIKNRTKIVLDKMNELGKIKTQEEYEAAVAKVEAGLTFTKGKVIETIYSYHTDAAIMQIINQLMEEKNLNYEAAKLYLYGGGFTIYTTQNTAIQNAMNEEAKKEKYINTSNGQQSQASMTLIDHKTGYVLGVIGGLGEKTTSLGLNRATQATKQTGSSMKPLAVVAPGIDKGIITAATVFDDVPYSIFKNYSNYRGLIT
ncbi:MAG: transglycosylase domain-containing protein, partial [Clostridia bacterium]|nr:transglycosylase domain-containing protein [Clostridia bacterium]